MHPARRRGDLFVAELDGTPRRLRAHGDAVTTSTNVAHAHVSVLAVTRDAEGNGVGSALLDHAERVGARARHRID